MRHLEFDVANSTPNPLYVPTTRAGEADAEEAGASSSRSDDHTHDTSRVREYLHYAARWLLLLVPPIVGIWGWDNDALVRPHMLSFTLFSLPSPSESTYASYHKTSAVIEEGILKRVVEGIHIGNLTKNVLFVLRP